MNKFVLFVLVFASFAAQAGSVCSSIFLEKDAAEKAIELETETLNGKPRYFSVRNYSHFKGGELDAYLKSIRNLTQFSEKLAEINTFTPDRSTIPSEAFFVANQMIPLIENFLKTHDVAYKIETYEKADDLRPRKSLIVISESGSNNLNELAAQLGKHGKILLTIDPVELFYGYEHYHQSRGKFFDIDSYTPGYAMSFTLLLHSQRKDFDYKTSREDPELTKMRMEIQAENLQKAGPDNIEGQSAREGFEDSFKESRKKAADHINKLIEQARNKKGSLN